MESLPADVEATLLRGVTAYLRATPATELPASLRRFRNFRPQSLAAHKRQILDALDDPAFRALVGAWLDDRPSLSKTDAEALRSAVDRTDGWHEHLAGTGGTKRSSSSSKPKTGDLVAREREKLRKAREEGRRKLEDANLRIKELRTRVADLEAATKEAAVERAALEKDLENARKESVRSAAELDREKRKTRVALERARQTADKARADAKELRQELRSLRSEMQRSKGAAKRKTTARKKPQAAPRGPRRALPVPKGRFEDDPATLEAWLRADGVHLLVDGYNASMSKEGFAHLDLARQRQRLVEEVVKLARRLEVPTTIVFDGSDVAGTIRQPRGPAKVHYSAADEIADDHLIGLIESMPQVPVVVATSDRELQERAASLGATVATSEQLLTLLR